MLSWYRVVRLRRLQLEYMDSVKKGLNVRGMSVEQKKKRVILHDRNDGRVVVNT